MTYRETYQFTHANYWLETLQKQFPEYDKGQLYLNRFCEACDHLISKGVINGYQVWPKHSSKDNSGIDITLDKGNNILIDFSITSSYINAQSHIETNERNPKRGRIRIVYVREGNRPVMKSVENLEREIVRKINLKF